MTSNSTRNGPRWRLPVLLAAVVTALAVLLSPLAAFADTYDDSGPGGGAHKGGNGGSTVIDTKYQCGETIGKLAGALYELVNGNWKQVFEANHPNCGRGNLSTTERFVADGTWKICPTGFEVYRFYGIEGQPAKTAVTRSRLNLPGWCQSESNYTFAGQTAWDAHPSSAPGLPDFQAQASSVDQRRNGMDDQVGRRENGNLTSGAPTVVQGSCTTISKANPLKAWYAKADAAARVNFGISIGAQYKTLALVKSGGRTYTYPLTALEELGLSDANVYTYSKANANQAKDPVKDPNGKNYFVKDPTFSTAACATPFNFATIQNATTGKVIGGVPQTGTCYVPLMRVAKGFSLGSTKSWGFESLAAGFGERYSDYYVKENGGREKPGDSVPVAWRKIMERDYKARSAKATNKFYNGAGRQILPANHYPSEDNRSVMSKKTSTSVAAAAHELAYWSKCRFGTHVTFESSDSTKQKAPAAKLLLTSHNQKVLQAGGAPFQSRFTVSAGDLMCGSSACGANETLTSLSYTMKVQGTNGYTQCAAGQLSGCDFRVVSSQAGSAAQDGSIVVEFYHATTGSQRVKYVVTGLQAKYSYTVAASTVEMTGYDPVTGKPYQYKVTTPGYTKIVSFTPALVGDPKPQAGSGAGPYTVTYPVIGAVDVPGN